MKLWDDLVTEESEAATKDEVSRDCGWSTDEELAGASSAEDL